ncbi:gamma-glutamyl AIG2-like cyclotransferase [Nocardia tenerifensis]|uniref:Putative gamma-glutamylcyclotransferase n=1 Tax=Nocardia tenerifensis TaxID=228006 RepID=A0A318JSU4_9NOCA|nr:gamma-glutamylcyclotransferase family protein [Nocardia tenerifensis]PXX54572.1 gamma-glutamyl AIG2-like cyclotransferase [Nocardia tenerifensis]
MSQLSLTGRRWNEVAGQGHSLFAYGTLQFPEVLEVLIDRVPSLTPTAAPGWRVAALTDRLYPGLVAAPSSVAHGVVLDDLTASEWAILDTFEDDEYDLRTISVLDPPRTALTYVWTDVVGQALWHPEVFIENHLPAFLARTRTWRTTLRWQSAMASLPL